MVVDSVERPRTERKVRAPIPLDTAIEDTLAMLGEKGMPIFDKREEIADLIRANNILIIEAETGSGKSTVVPILALAELQGRNPDGRVIVTQPRRFAAQNLDTFLMPTMGNRVGFRHGGGASSGIEDAQLTFTVEQTLLNELARDKSLSKYDTVILDEVHERTVVLDTLIPLLLEAQSRRPENKPLKIILASATMDKKKMLDYLKGSSHVEASGKMFDVEEHYETQRIDPRDLMELAAQKASQIHTRGEEEPGDMLIFMPGQMEIERTIEALRRYRNLTDDEVEFVPLSGGGETAESIRKIYEPSSKRRIFVATNVAETSVTIPSVRVVIDSGLMRLKVFNPETGISGLQTLEHTQSNAKQRKGRAGRTATGNVHFLFTKEEYAQKEPYLKAEILRVDLVAQVLLMKELGISDIVNFNFIDHPGKEKITHAIETLKRLGALNPDGSLSEIGKQMTEIGAEPRFARMIVEARKLGVEEEVTFVVGMLQNPGYDVFDYNYLKGTPLVTKDVYKRFFIPGSDILTRLNVWNEYLQNNSSKEARQRWETANQLRTLGLYKASTARREILNNKEIEDKPIDVGPVNAAKIARSIAAGLLDNIVAKQNGTYQTLDGRTRLGIDKRNSVLTGNESDLIISANLRSTERNGVFAGMNFTIPVEELKKLAPEIASMFGGEQGNETEQASGQETAASQAEINRELQQIAFVPPYETTPSEAEHEKSRKERWAQKLREIIRYWLKKLRIKR